MHELINIPATDRTTVLPSASEVWRDFCDAVSTVIDTTPISQVPERIAAMMPDLLSKPGLLTAAQRSAPADGYGRNRVFICPCDKFSVLAMVWPAGVSTPIHDHRDWCALGVYEGEIEETGFDAVGPAVAAPRATVRLRRGDAAHLPVDAPNIHRIHNPTGRAAISIHVYGGNCEKNGPNLDTVYTLDP